MITDLVYKNRGFLSAKNKKNILLLQEVRFYLIIVYGFLKRIGAM